VYDARMHTEEFVKRFLHSYTQEDYQSVEMADQSQIERVRKSIRKDTQSNWLWHWYCHNHGEKITDPSRQPSQYVTWFLDTYFNGTFELQEMATEDQISRVKKIIRNGTADQRSQWFWYTRLVGNGIREPRDLPRSIVQHFLEIMHSGQRVVPTTSRNLAKEFVEMQAKDLSFNWLWHLYCASHTCEIADVNLVPEELTRHFLRLYAEGVLWQPTMTPDEMARPLQEKLEKKEELSARWASFVRKKGFRTRNPRGLPCEVVLQFLATLPDHFELDWPDLQAMNTRPPVISGPAGSSRSFSGHMRAL